MSYGLKGKVRKIMTELNAVREHKERPRNMTLRQFLSEHYKGADGKPLTTGHLFADLNIDPRFTTVQELYGDDDMKWLMPEIVRDSIRQGMGMAAREQLAELRRAVVSQSPIISEVGGQHFITPEVFLDPVMRGAVQAAFYADLIIREIGVPQPNVVVPFLDLSDASLTESDEVVTIEEGSVTYGTKTVKLKKRGRGIKISYEAIEFNTLDLAALFFLDLGRLLASRLNGDCVETIINGDQDDDSEAAAIIGVEDVTEGFQYRDILRVWIRLSLLGRQSTSIIGNEDTASEYLDLPPVKNRQFAGSPLLATRMKTPLPTEQDLYASVKVADNQLAFQDSSMSLVQLTARPLMVESDKIISKQLAESVASIYTGFCKLQRNASIILDKTVAFADQGFPTWMNPFSE
jgi:hypothetical protein